jgi:hypothetical protein
MAFGGAVMLTIGVACLDSQRKAIISETEPGQIELNDRPENEAR